MSTSLLVRRCTGVALFLVLGPASSAMAQTGAILGRVTDAETGAGLGDASVEVLSGGGPAMTSVLSNQEGQFRAANLSPGTYALVVSLIGYETMRVDGVQVRGGQTTNVSVQLTSRAFLLNPIVVTASRRQEKALEAPATVSVVDARAIAERPTVTPVEHVRAAPGMDIITHGLQSSNIVARGFNNIFSTTLHMLTDNRLASVPSLRVNLVHFTPQTDQDIDRIEVVLGPGSALYGPNTANGVLHIITRSPLDHPGTSFSLAGGERDVFHGTLRTAHRVSDAFGVKVSGQYLKGSEWEFQDLVEGAARAEIDNPQTRPAAEARLRRTCLSTDPGFKQTCENDIPQRLRRIGIRDFDLERWSLEARADWRAESGLNAIFAYGQSTEESGIELTGIGAAQAKGWTYRYYQARGSYNRWFGQVYLNTSDAGDTYLLRDGAKIVDESKLLVAQLQHGFSLARGRQEFTYGIDYFRTMPDTKGTINGRNEDDDETTEVGGYIQSQTALDPKFDLVLAARVDDHSELEDAVFSPRAGLVFKPSESQNIRLTYNRAFSTPTNFNLWLDLNSGPAPNAALAALGFNLRAQGVTRDGLRLHRADGSLGMRSPFTPAAAGGAGQLLPGNADALAGFWQAAVSVLQAQSAARGQPLPPQLVAYLRSQAPTGADVGIAGLDLNTQQVAPLTPGAVQDIPLLKPSITSTVELGYTGILGDRVRLLADAWWQQRRNFTSDLRAQTPLVLYDGTKLGAWLVPRMMAIGVPQAQAQAIAVGLASIPLAVVSSEEINAAGADILASYRNFGKVDLWGADLALHALLSDEWTLELGGSFASDHFFKTEGQIVGLNAPKVKGSAALAYRNSRAGVNGEVRVRHTGEFPVNSAPFYGLACIRSSVPATALGVDTDCVQSYTLVDLTLGYGLPMARGATLQLAVQNLFDAKYQSFLGVPEIGRFALARVKYEF